MAQITEKLPADIDNLLQDISQYYRFLSYMDIVKLGNIATKEDIRKIRLMITDLYDTKFDDKQVKEICLKVSNLVKSIIQK